MIFNSFWTILSIYSIFIFPTVTCTCPSGCICANTIVLCTCPPTASSTILGSFRHIDFLSEIFIYNCRNLTIPSDTFSSLALSHELKINAISSLHIHPFAFRNLVKYPEKFSISDSSIPELPGDSFAGFHHVKHVWFRNVNLSIISSGAFRHIRDIEYVYFRESRIGRIEYDAFSNMTNIDHLFIRGSIKIDRIETSQFRFSTIKKIVFEDVRIRTLNAYAFSDGPSYFDSFLFDNITIDYVDSVNSQWGKLENTSGTSRGRMIFRRCNFIRRFPIASFCSNIFEVKIEETSIDRLSPISFINMINITKLEFNRCKIRVIEKWTFYGSSNISWISFRDTEIKNINENAFGNALMNRLTFARANIGQISGVILEKSKISTIDFESCQIGEFDSKSFSESKIGLLNISTCKFPSHQDSEWLSNISFRNLILQRNTFRCTCSSKMIRSLGRMTKEKLWLISDGVSIKDNFCMDKSPADLITIENYFDLNCEVEKMDYESFGGLKCGRNLFLSYCTCDRSKKDQKIITDQYTINKLSILISSSILMISDCSNLQFRPNAFTHLPLTHLIIKNIENLALQSGFLNQNSPSISTLLFFDIQSIQFHPGSFLFSSSLYNIDIKFENCTIPTFPAGIFQNAYFGHLIFRNCQLVRIESFFIQKSNIGEFRIENCKIGRFSRWAFEETTVEILHFENNRFYELKSDIFQENILKNALVCLMDNRFACHCDMAGLEAMLNSNACDNGNNLCMQERNGINQAPMSNIISEWAYDENGMNYYENIEEYQCPGNGEGVYGQMINDDRREIRVSSRCPLICNQSVLVLCIFAVFLVFSV